MSQSKRSFPTLLVISLCVNAIAFGIIGGTWISNARHNSHERADHQHREDNRGPFEERLARTALRDLPEGQREEMRDIFSQRWRSAQDLRDQMDSARARIAELLAADPLDEDALTAAFDEVRDAEFRLREQFYASLTQTLMAVPAERRADIVERSMSRRERRDDRRGERGERSDRGEDHRPPPPPPRD